MNMFYVRGVIVEDMEWKWINFLKRVLEVLEIKFLIF